MNEKTKVQNSVRWKYKFYKAILEVSSFWRGFIWSTKLDSRYTSEEESMREALLSIITTWSHDFDKHVYLKYSHTQMCRWIDIFQSHVTPLWWHYWLLGRSSHFLLLLRKKMIFVSLFSGKEFLIYKFKPLSLLKRLYSMPSTTFMILYLSHHDILVRHRPDLLNPCNV